MTRRHRPFSRRAVLRGLGASLALPPAGGAGRAGGPAGRARWPPPLGAPLRLAFVGVPNGVNLECWRPTGTGPRVQAGPDLCPGGRAQVEAAGLHRLRPAQRRRPGRRPRGPRPRQRRLPDRLPPAQDRQAPTSATASRSIRWPPRSCGGRHPAALPGADLRCGPGAAAPATRVTAAPTNTTCPGPPRPAHAGRVRPPPGVRAPVRRRAAPGSAAPVPGTTAAAPQPARFHPRGGARARGPAGRRDRRKLDEYLGGRARGGAADRARRAAPVAAHRTGRRPAASPRTSAPTSA